MSEPKLSIMTNRPEENSILRACGYCLKVIKTDNEKQVNCHSCSLEVAKLIQRGDLEPFIPKSLWQRIKELEEKVERLERK